MAFERLMSQFSVVDIPSYTVTFEPVHNGVPKAEIVVQVLSFINITLQNLVVTIRTLRKSSNRTATKPE